MGSPEVLDLAKLLCPIAGDNPAGRPLREETAHDAVFYALRDCRSSARAAERSLLFPSEGGGESPRPDWRPILQKAPKVLAEESKDLEVACWLIEALVREHGYAGLRDGFRLARGLVENFWEGLYPLPDEEGVATRVAPLAALNGIETEGVLIPAIRNVPITQPGAVRPISVADYQQAVEVDRIADPDKRAQRLAQGILSMDQVREAIRGTSEAFFRNVLEDLTACIEEWDRLSGILDEKCGQGPDGAPASPPSSNIRNTLQTCRETVEYIAREALGGPISAAPAAPGSPPALSAEAPALAQGAAIANRESAFRMLLQVAEFFRRTEPHSPVSYALEQAVRWGRMPLPELWTELIPEETVRGTLFKMVGIRPRNESGRTD